MNRSADRLNLCLSELKGAEQLKNFSPFFFIIIVRSRNDFLSRSKWKFKKKKKKKKTAHYWLEIRISIFSSTDRIFFNPIVLFYFVKEVKEKEWFSKTKIETRWI